MNPPPGEPSKAGAEGSLPRDAGSPGMADAHPGYGLNDRLELADGRELWRVDFEARPKETHPLFWQSACGILTVWLFAHKMEDAVPRAIELIDTWEFELTDETARCAKSRTEGSTALRIFAEQAELLGFSAIYSPYDHKAGERDIPFPGEGA